MSNFLGGPLDGRQMAVQGDASNFVVALLPPIDLAGYSEEPVRIFEGEYRRNVHGAYVWGGYPEGYPRGG